jgi:hypothetical protein
MPGAPYFLGCRRPLTLMVRGARSSLRRFLSEASRIREEIIKMKIGAVALGAATAFGIVAGAWAQSSGAGGTGGGAAGGGVGGNTMGGSTGVRVTAPTPNANPSTPNTVSAISADTGLTGNSDQSRKWNALIANTIDVA